MHFSIQEINEQKIAVVDSPGLKIETGQEALDLMANAGYLGARAIILPAETGVAGDILQKFSNYRMKLAITGAFEGYQSRSLAAFIRESNRGNLVFFVPDMETALDYLFPDVKIKKSPREERP